MGAIFSRDNTSFSYLPHWGSIAAYLNKLLLQYWSHIWLHSSSIGWFESIHCIYPTYTSIREFYSGFTIKDQCTHKTLQRSYTCKESGVSTVLRTVPNPATWTIIWRFKANRVFTVHQTISWASQMYHLMQSNQQLILPSWQHLWGSLDPQEVRWEICSHSWWAQCPHSWRNKCYPEKDSRNHRYLSLLSAFSNNIGSASPQVSWEVGHILHIADLKPKISQSFRD